MSALLAAAAAVAFLACVGHQLRRLACERCDDASWCKACDTPALTFAGLCDRCRQWLNSW